jgi:hypothetical protein
MTMGQEFSIGDQVTFRDEPRALVVVKIDASGVHCQIPGAKGKTVVHQPEDLKNHGKPGPMRPIL